MFGKLPSTRPGVRSPRRGKGSAKGRPAPASKATKRAPGQVGASGLPPSLDPRLRRALSPEPETPETGDGPGVEDLAWAGITVAAEAATLGVRLLSRALEAVRGPGDSR